MIIVGHRGARGLAPENTLASLKKAIDHDVDMIEFDIRVSSDGVPLLHHDAHVIDPNGEKHLIANTKFVELVDHKKDLVSLRETLKELPQQAILYIEVKTGVPTMPVISELKRAHENGWPLANMYIASFDIKVLNELHTALPELPIIVNELWSGMRAGRRARMLDTKYISMDRRWLWRGFIGPVTRRGWKLMAYTVNDPKKAYRWQKYGLYGVVTDYPDRFERNNLHSD